MASDGKVVISTALDNSGLPKGIGQAKGMLGGLGGVVKKLGGVIVAAFSVKAVADFAKECLDLGSDLQEVQNVVDVTFTTMNEQVNEFAKNAARTAGLSETMAKKYAGTFGAMAKSFKFTEAEAFEMSTSLTQLSGDVASFYNLSQDEAYTKLKSVFTGETESLKDLGVVMTQTALDSYALANGFGKTTSQMTEQEKVALRYRFVMDQLAGASGDFLRTSDSWANQTRLLTLQFDQLKATLGQGLINVLMPVIKLLNTLLTQLQGVADAFLSFTNAVFGNAGGGSVENAAESYTAAADGAEALAENAEKAGKATKKSLAGFDELNIVQKGDGGSNSGSFAGGPTTSMSAGTINVTADVQDSVSPAIQAITDKIMHLIEPLCNINFSPVMESFGRLGAAIGNFGLIVLDTLEWAWFNLLVPLSQWTIQDAAPAVLDLLSSSFDLLSAALAPVISGLKILRVSLEPVFAWIGETAIWILGQFREQFDKVAQIFRDKGPEIEKIFSGLGEIVTVVWSMIQPTLASMKAYWGFVFDLMGSYTANFVSYIIDLLGGIVEFFAGVFTGDWKRAVNGLIDIVNGLISGALGGINALIGAMNKLNFNIPDWVPLIGGKTFGFNIPTMKVPQIPHLAQGAVIPPNREFMAVLGDQRHGTNIEAPLTTIQEAVEAVMADYEMANLAGHEAVVAVLKEILEAILGIQIGDEVIARAVDRYNRKMAVVRGDA